MLEKPMPAETPKVSFGTARTRVDRMWQAATDLRFEAMGAVFEPDLREPLATVIMRGLGQSSGIPREAVVATLSEMQGRPLDRETLDWIFNRVAHDPDTLHAGAALSGFTGDLPEETWTALEIRDVYFREGSIVTIGARVCWGALWGLSVFKHVDVLKPQLGSLMYRLGLKTRGRRNSDGEPREIVQYRFWAELTLKQGYVTFSRYKVDDQCDAWNSSIRSNRKRDCPYGYTHRCHYCPHGYAAGTLMQCKRATRLVTIKLPSEETDKAAHEHADSHSVDGG